MGRPSLYTPELADQICNRIALGESLREISKTEGNPTAVQFFSWLGSDHELFVKWKSSVMKSRKVFSQHRLDRHK